MVSNVVLGSCDQAKLVQELQHQRPVANVGLREKGLDGAVLVTHAEDLAGYRYLALQRLCNAGLAVSKEHGAILEQGNQLLLGIVCVEEPKKGVKVVLCERHRNF